MKRSRSLMCAFLLLAGLALPGRAVNTAPVRFFSEAEGQYGPVTASQLVSVVFDGTEMELDVPAVTRTVDGVDARTLVPVRPIAEALGATVLWEQENRQVILFYGQDTIVLTLGSAQATVNGQWMDLPGGVPAQLADYGGVERTLVPLLFVSQQLHAQVSWDGATWTAQVTPGEGGEAGQPVPEEPEPTPEETDGPTSEEPEPVPEATAEPVPVPDPNFRLEADLTGWTVVLDAGHGGQANGAEYGGVREKDIDLAVTLCAARLLEEAGCRVVLTRSEDVYVGLYDRSDIANAAKADLFLSVHANASVTNPDHQGTYTYYFPGSRKGRALAQCVQRAVAASAGSIDRGLLTDNFVVLRETKMPAALVELGFMSSAQELERLVDPNYQIWLAQGVAQGVANYLGTL